MRNQKKLKGFTLIEVLIAVIWYAILLLWVMQIYTLYTNYKISAKYWNKDLYIKNFVEDSDKLMCYKWWANKTNTESEKTYCNSFENNPNIKFFVSTLINIRDIKIKKTLFIKKSWDENYLWLTTNTDTTIDERISNTIQKYRIFTWNNGFLNISIKQKWSPLNLNLIIISNDLLE